MLALGKILSWIIDPRNRTVILFLLFVGAIFLYLYQRSRTKDFKYKYKEQVQETNRVENNFKASQDTLEMYKDKNGNLIGEISGYKLTVDELKKDKKDLFTLYDAERKKPPKTIIEVRYKIRDSLLTPTQVNEDYISFSDTADYGNGNYRIINTVIPYNIYYHIKKDSVNSFEFIKALDYAYQLTQVGIEDAFVVIYENNRRVSYRNIKDYDSVIYRVQIHASSNNYSNKEISDKFGVDKKSVYKVYEDGLYKYMVGEFVPKSNNEPPISIDELYTYGKLITGDAKTDIAISMALGTSLYRDPNTGEIKIQVITKYPGITFQDIRGADIMSTIKEDKKLTRSFRKEWGVGINFGYGGMLVPENNQFKLKTGPTFNIGINYTPSWLQFGGGKSSDKKNMIDDILN